MRFRFQSLQESTPPERPNNISSNVFKLLRNAIVTLKLSPGNALSEAEVAKQLKVSRQPVREAFIQLSRIGMVNIIPQKGTFIVKINRQDVENARFIREVIETALATRACQTATKEMIEEMHGLIVLQHSTAQNSDHERFLELDDEFHQTIAKSAQCLYGWSIIEDLKAQMDRVRFLSLPEAIPMDKLVEQHRQIVRAIQNKDQEAVSLAVKNHLTELLTSLPKLAERHQDLFSDYPNTPG